RLDRKLLSRLDPLSHRAPEPCLGEEELGSAAQDLEAGFRPLDLGLGDVENAGLADLVLRAHAFQDLGRELLRFRADFDVLASDLEVDSGLTKLALDLEGELALEG